MQEATFGMPTIELSEYVVEAGDCTWYSGRKRAASEMRRHAIAGSAPPVLMTVRRTGANRVASKMFVANAADGQVAEATATNTAKSVEKKAATAPALHRDDIVKRLNGPGTERVPQCFLPSCKRASLSHRASLKPRSEKAIYDIWRLLNSI